MILIVGISPSKYNYNPLVPFQGAKCEPRLKSWLKRLKISNYEAVNVSDMVLPSGRSLKVSEYNLERLRHYCNRADKIIALGRVSEDAVRRVTDKPIFYMPHPSGGNFAINSTQYVDKMLQNCYSFLWSQK